MAMVMPYHGYAVIITDVLPTARDMSEVCLHDMIIKQ